MCYCCSQCLNVVLDASSKRTFLESGLAHHLGVALTYFSAVTSVLPMSQTLLQEDPKKANDFRGLNFRFFLCFSKPLVAVLHRIYDLLEGTEMEGEGACMA